MDMSDILSRAGNQLVVGRAFGPPIERDGQTIVPVAFVAGGGGAGRGTAGQAEASEGGGFGGVVHPLGVYVIGGGAPRFIPTVDVTRVLMGALSLLVAIAAPRLLSRSLDPAPAHGGTRLPKHSHARTRRRRCRGVGRAGWTR